MLRKAAPLPGEYKVGDVVVFQREQGAVTEDDRWNPGSRIIGFDGEGGKTCWVINGGVPFCVATDQLRPCTPAEALAYAYMHKTYNRAPTNQQQSFVDYRKVRREEQPHEPRQPKSNNMSLDSRRHLKLRRLNQPNCPQFQIQNPRTKGCSGKAAR